MSLTDGNGSGLSAADVAAVVGSNGGYGNGGWGFGGDGAWWLLVLFLFAFAGNGWGFGGGAGNGAIPYMMSNSTNADVQRGFDQSAVMNGITGLNSAVTSGFAGVNQGLCSGFAGVNQTVSNGFANAEIAANARQIADMQQAFSSQTALAAQLNTMAANQANCCCENRLGLANLSADIAREACADRASVNDALRDVITNNTANTQALLNTVNGGIQAIKDQLCNDKIDAKNERIAALENQLNMAQLAASQNAQTAALIANNEAQTTALERYLAPNPVPAYIVQNPMCCNQNYGYGCGCAA